MNRVLQHREHRISRDSRCGHAGPFGPGWRRIRAQHEKARALATKTPIRWGYFEDELILLPPNYYTLVAELPNTVLLETSRPDSENQRSYLFVNPASIFGVANLADIPKLFDWIDSRLLAGFFVAGFLSYECGYHFEPRANMRPLEKSNLPLAWFGAYEQPFTFDHSAGTLEPELTRTWSNSALPPVPAGVSPVSCCRLEISRTEYCAKVEAIRAYIAAGDTYQVNLTTKARFRYTGSPATVFTALRNQQSVKYAAYIHLENRHILSLSPELFFRMDSGRIVTRPMKGTVRRGKTAAEDSQLQMWLREDAKNRSENIMIVDLLRNDLGKIAEVGSVRVDELFAVEKYETLFQMTSTVSASLRAGTKPYEIFSAIFPSGSVTGAPKCRTMQIIQELENAPRGVYTGAIGFFSPSHNAVFNVPIRTAVLEAGSGEMGVGGGIVFDSLAEQEYEECLLKLQFLARSEPVFQLVETLRWGGKYHFLKEHLRRLRSSAEYFGFPFSESHVALTLEQNQHGLKGDVVYRVRLLLDVRGSISLENLVLDPEPPISTIKMSPIRTFSQDRFLYHKTTCRSLYEHECAEARRLGYQDVVFQNERGEVTEAANNNIFVQIGGRLVTPPVECGLLAGIFRQYVLENEQRASERILSYEDLKTADAIFLCNSVRGMRQVTMD